MSSEKVNIRPGVSMLSILKHIEYDPWYALAEFVDNAVDSYLKYEKEIKAVEGEDFQLEVKIDLNDTDNKITIRDNAAGIHKKDYARAFRAAEIPPDNSGLSEFGMGMKSAACWFSDNWTVRTTALGENIEKTVSFDLNKIFYDKLEELDVKTKPKKESAHYTIVELTGINKMPIKKTKGKIKDHLASIYRNFIRKGTLKLYLDSEILEYKDPAILIAPFPHDSNSKPIQWKKEINLEIIKGKMSIKGFVGLLEKMETGKNGFALFRRGRVIEGSGENGFTPKEIMGQSGSPEWKRIFGELHLEGFNVSFTKKDIKWDENMEIFLDLLRSDLSKPAFPLLKQARNYTKNPTKSDLKKAAEIVVKSTVEDIKGNVKEALGGIRAAPVLKEQTTKLTKTEEVSTREFEISFKDTKWLVSIELCYDESITDWIEIGSHVLKDKSKTIRQVGIRMSLSHPFIIRFAGTDKSKLEAILHIAAAIGLAEESAREDGVKQAGKIRMNINKLLTSISKSNHEQ